MVKLFSSICLILCLIYPQNIYATTYSNAVQGKSEVSIRIVKKIGEDETQRKADERMLPKTGNHSYHNDIWLLGVMFLVLAMKIRYLKRREKRNENEIIINSISR